MKYDEVADYDSGLAKVLINRQIGVVDGKGSVILPPGFDSIRMVGDLIQTEKNDDMGYLDTQGRWVWEPSR
jgi:hypothetical protein